MPMKMWREMKPLYIIGGNVNFCKHYGNQYGDPQKTKIELSYDPAIPLLGMNLKAC
jgi:hypothetical protein